MAKNSSKLLKIAIPVIVVLVIAFFVIKSFYQVNNSTSKAPASQAATNTNVCKVQNSTKTELSGKIFGTTYHISYFANEIPNLTKEQVQAKLDTMLHTFNHIVSTYDPTSTISEFNKFDKANVAYPIPKEFAVIYQEAEKVNKLSGGYYDVTVYPLVKAWGFGPGKPIPHFSPQEVAQFKTHVGMDKIVLSEKDGQYYLTKLDPQVSVDFSSIAKGRGVDLAGDLLAKLGAKNYIVEIGGEVVAKGVNECGNPWRVAIEQPTYDGSEIVNTIIGVKNQGIATSGNYRNFRYVDGHRITHEIDPFTGYPITHNTASLTVVAPNDMIADAWSTALYVMGSEKAIALADKLGIAIFCIDYVDGKYVTKQSKTFKTDVNVIATE